MGLKGLKGRGHDGPLGPRNRTETATGDILEPRTKTCDSPWRTLTCPETRLPDVVTDGPRVLCDRGLVGGSRGLFDVGGFRKTNLKSDTPILSPLPPYSYSSLYFR